MQTSQSLVAGVVSGMLLSLVLGVVVGGLTFWLFRRWRRVSRIVDLFSYTIAGVGLLASVFAIAAFEKRISQTVQLSTLVGDSLKAVKHVSSIVREKCPLKSQSEQSSGCKRLAEYSESLVDLNFYRGSMLPSPPSPIEVSIANLPAYSAYSEIERIVYDYNEQARKFFEKEYQRPTSDETVDEIARIIYSAYAVSFAFGMGWTRRAYDAWKAA